LFGGLAAFCKVDFYGVPAALCGRFEVEARSREWGVPASDMRSVPEPQTEDGRKPRMPGVRGLRWVRRSVLRRTRSRALPLALALLVGGLAISLGAALLWHSRVRGQERQNFETRVEDASATIATELRGDVDFIATVRALVTMHPHLSASSFDRWYSELRSVDSDVGGAATAVVSRVPADRLAAFQARRRADPVFMRLAGGDTSISPPGRRSHYCLLSAGVSRLARSPLVQEATHLDWCSSAFPKLTDDLRSESETGQIAASPEELGTVFVGSAVYRWHAPLVTPAQRRAATVAWVWSSLDVPMLIRGAIGAHRNLGIALFHDNDGSTTLAIGAAGVGAARGPFHLSKVLHIDGRWIVHAVGASTIAGLSAVSQSALVLGFGAIVSILLATLVLVLGRSRQRALGLVDEKTGQLRHQALHDALTGLPNRVLALDRAEQMLARGRRRKAPVAALFVDLDGFKHVNDTFGHAAGDELLQIVAERLRRTVRDGDTAARLGGDEFVVLMDSLELDAGPELLAERLLDVLRLPYEIDGKGGRQLGLTASIGLASGLRASADELLRDADVALYEAKAAGRDRCVVFESRMQTAIQDRLTLEMDLGEALEREQLHLVYQPIFELRTGRVVAVEALLRWRHPTRGLVGPAEFIPIAEQCGLIVPFGRWVLEAACAQAAGWRRLGHDVGVAVNVSAVQIDQEGLVEEVRCTLRDSALDAAALTLEVTETTIMRDAPVSAKRLRALKELGVKIAIDDFGTGYSSLAYLRQFPVDSLKIDRSFVSSIASSKEAVALIHTLVQLGRTLELSTVAEGIDDPSQLRTLRREGCVYGQGFLLAKPMSPEAVEQLLRGETTVDADETTAGR
jgi:diguanylate cyclase (GGDEF)-like protein